ncbi:MAG: methionine gamma-lyase family protein [Acidaminococcaceae bacterium]|nr:methionine gamma-lyase family protein [Acidaminococcaceae bacterium]
MIDYKKVEAKALEIVSLHAKRLEETALFNTEKVITAFRKNMVSDYYLKPTTGYAYSDVGRDSLDSIYADIFRTEAALVRSQFVSGTHALAVAMSGNLKPGDELVAVTGSPYDTMQTIIGSPVVTEGSLVDSGIIYKEIPMIGNKANLQLIKETVSATTKMVHIQRSCGYSSHRSTIDIAEIARICRTVKDINPAIICFVDNCYGEFIETQEPTEVGADLIAGSLIKNLGGGLAPTGGYIAGRADLVEKASYRLTAPGLGGEMGATLGDTAREFYQGLFLAPHVVMQAVKTAVFAAGVFAELGYEVKPKAESTRSDIIQCITLRSRENLCGFCRAVQANSPIDAHVEPVPSPLPGYADEIIMAAGTFVQGASIELSADGPCREPYNVFLQGGLTFEHGRLAIMAAAKSVGEYRE